MTHRVELIKLGKTCLSYDWFGYLSRIMVVDKNEIIPFQKSPWNALCKNGISLKYQFFYSKPNFKTNFFNQALPQHHFCTVNSLLMLQKSLGYAINKFGRFDRVAEKIVIFNKIKNFKKN